MSSREGIESQNKSLFKNKNPENYVFKKMSSREGIESQNKPLCKNKNPETPIFEENGIDERTIIMFYEKRKHNNKYDSQTKTHQRNYPITHLPPLVP